MRIPRSMLVGPAVLALAGGLAVSATPALAGFDYSASAPIVVFGGAGSEEGQFLGPSGVAVDQTTGDVYVADQGNDRVEKFNAAGAYLSQITGGPEGLSSPMGVAVDNSQGPSAGDLYVVSAGDRIVEKFNSKGEYLGEITGTGSGPFGPIEGIAVSASGDLWVYERAYEPVLEENLGVVDKFDGALSNAYLSQWSTHTNSPETVPGMAVDSNENVYVSHYFGYGIDKFSGSGERLEGLSGPKLKCPTRRGPCSSGLAVDQLYPLVDYGAYVSAFTPGGVEYARFGEGYLSSGSGLAVNDTTGDVYVADGGADDVAVFAPYAEISVPAVNDVAPTVSARMRTTAVLEGAIDPENLTTSYHIEYVDGGEYEPAAANPYANGGRTGPRELGAAGVDESVRVALTGLLAGTTYHYRLVASNLEGTTYGPDYTFTTAAATTPVVVTGTAVQVGQTTATLTGTVGAQGVQTSYEFEVGTDLNYGGAKLFGNAGQSAGSEAVSASLQFLVPGTTYHYRLLATNADGTTYGQDVTFTTSAVSLPITQPASEALIASPTVVFPSVTGAVTKPPGSGKHAKKKRPKGKQGKKGKAGGKRRAKGRAKAGKPKKAGG